MFEASTKCRVEEGFRSKLEVEGARQLVENGVEWSYESEKVPYVVPARTANYIPDFPIGKKGGKRIYLEFKGWPFEAKDRQKMLLVKEQHPDKDIRFIFQNASQKLYTGSKTTVSMWANEHGFKWADKGIIPVAWMKEVK